MNLTIELSDEFKKAITQAVAQEVSKFTVAAAKAVMTKDEVIAYFDISEGTLKTWRHEGLQELRRGDKIYFKFDDIIDFLAYS